jgi:hypothetical protein
MIKQLYTDVFEATTPSRELDARLHEVLTGEINMCKDVGIKLNNLEHGRLLLEKGGELRWFDVPEYTGRLECIAAMFGDHTLRLCRVPDNVLKEAARLPIPAEIVNHFKDRGWFAETDIGDATVQAFGYTPAQVVCIALLGKMIGPEVTMRMS